MLNGAKSYIRHKLLAWRDAGAFPVLLPHHRPADGGLRTLARPATPLPPEVVRALGLCDGTRTAAQVCRESGAPSAALTDLHDAEVLLLWPAAVGEGGGRARSIIISPHPDDASLCLGGMMIRDGPGSCVVVDVFTRTAWTRFPAEINDAAAIHDLRMAEERLMARLTGSALRILDLPEAMLRQHAFADVFTDGPTSLDQDVRRAVQSAVPGLLAEFADATWYLPLAVGNHLDHRIVRDAAMATLEQHAVPRGRIRFYEDLPYAEKLGGVPDFAGVLPGQTLVPEIIDIEPQMRWKLELNRAYWSQFPWSHLLKLREYAQRIGQGRAVERLWRWEDNQRKEPTR